MNYCARPHPGRGGLGGNPGLGFFRIADQECQNRDPIPVAVCWPRSQVSLAGAVEAAEAGLILPQLIGPALAIRSIAAESGLNLDPYDILDVDTEEEAARRSVELCLTVGAKALMKGSLHTDLLMRFVLQKDGGLRTSHRLAMSLSWMPPFMRGRS